MSISKKISRTRPPGVHFIGIGGIGMSGLARYFISRGWRVSGSDAARSMMTQELAKESITVKIRHKKGNIPADAHLVIYNRAIRPDNPELMAALAKKDVVVMTYAQALGRITEEYQTIAITGSHGKSTTTALAGLALIRAGLDPTILVGTKMADLGGRNIRVGHGAYLVLEADDFHAAFLNYSPAIAIVTNIDREHMDFYKTFANAKRAFLKFIARTRRGGTVILNRDDVPLRSLAPAIARLAKRHQLKVIWYSTHGKTGIAGARAIKRVIPISGEHNVSNAMAVLSLSNVLRVPEQKTLDAIGAYQGAWRRMELKGKLKGTAIPVYDDYAHHPTEIRATLAAFREKFPRSAIVCVFQPHQAKRLELLFKDFVGAFDAADMVFLLPLYTVLGRDEKFPHDSEALARALAARSPAKPIQYLHDPKKIRGSIETALRAAPLQKYFSKPPVIVMMGAGDISDLTGKLLN